ncbi:Na+/H+ antiporter subunit E [Pontibacter vulgaris]|uniref:Na+/H+ antiporter subunit E n=1 Tax=Pontibacter vulgaris TaxID=2905679 RepID=UPI001FA73284|nr:Na+/H+ antiporter subunit E [Pontibacter vulgaris]
MKTFLLHVIIALTVSYELLRSVITTAIPYNATFALLLFILVFILFWLTTALYNREYFRKLPKALGLYGYFIKEMIHANLTIAYDILTPSFSMTPSVLKLPLTARSNLEITLLVIIISLTPGTLCLDLDEDKRILYIHALYFDDGGTDKLRQSIKNGFERRLLEIMR